MLLKYNVIIFKTSLKQLKIFLCLGLLGLSSCKKFVEVPLPVDQLTLDFVFSNDNSALQALNGIYSQMIENDQQFCSGYTTLFTGMYADDLYYYTSGYRDEFVNDHITLVNQGLIESAFWTPCYKYIYAANKCIESVSNSDNVSPKTKSMIIGEARFIRAFCYFHLVNLFGDVPLVLSTVYQQNQSIPRSPEDEIYGQIINDLAAAKDSLQADYPTDERARPNKFAAEALLARVYLYDNDWADAENESTQIINSGIYSINTDLNSVFQSNSNETIWQLKPVISYLNTWEGYDIIPYSAQVAPSYLLTDDLVKSFEPGDLRFSAWINSENFSGQTLYYPFKYKTNFAPPNNEYYIVLRVAEQYLIRAEARARQGKITDAENDLNIIRSRAGLSDIVTTDKDSLLSLIAHERRVELFAEWGHRWFDLKRTGQAETVLQKLKPNTWQPTDTLWPVPQSQILLNPALTQNPGY